jgi:ABC-type transporter Mla maintaining outer membrane lipid asymmetry ATPase subunit MlaF
VLQDGRLLVSGTLHALDASQEPLVQAFMRAQGGG